MNPVTKYFGLKYLLCSLLPSHKPRLTKCIVNVDYVLRVNRIYSRHYILCLKQSIRSSDYYYSRLQSSDTPSLTSR